MTTNGISKTHRPEVKLLYQELSYQITGLCFEVQNTLGRFAREKQYSDLFENKLQTSNIPYKREYAVAGTGNRLDFLINDRIILEVKAKPFLLKNEYYQVKRYPDVLQLELALLVNFQDKYLKPRRILRPSEIIS
jgi:GxxExxY protein